MPKYKVILHEVREVAANTALLSFEKPSGFIFSAGQYCELAVPLRVDADNQGNSRTFSIASAPHETNLYFATRIGPSAFKRTLPLLKPGDECELEGPFGAFGLERGLPKKRHIFLVGGIGITPARSMILDALANKLPHQMILIYGNKKPEDALFLSEFQNLAKTASHFSFFPIMSEVENGSVVWNGASGYITKEWIREAVTSPEEGVFYVVGPPGMVRKMMEEVAAFGVPREYFKMEEFSGYS